VTGGVHGIAAWRAARQLTTVASGPDLSIKTLGPARIRSPLAALLDAKQTTEHYVEEGDRVLLDDTVSMVRARVRSVTDLPSFEPAGPRRTIFFDPSKTRAGIVTCGGLCPGLNDVIRGLVRNLTNHYGVRRVIGFHNGYQGFIASYAHDVVELTPQSVGDIHVDGGTVLGTFRGPQNPHEVVDCLERLGINILFVIGGDGTMRGAIRIVNVISERGSRIAVVGVPKTIDDDIPYLDQSFGVPDRVRPSQRVDPRRRRRGQGNPARRGSGETDGPALGVHRLLRRADPQRRRRGAHPRGGFPARWGGRVVGCWRRRFVHIPMALAVSKRNQVDPQGDLWMSVREATGQPARFGV
jgi:hypothetical protein